LNGTYALVGDSVVMGRLISTRMAGEPALMELEQNFARTLGTVDGFHVHGNELELLRKGSVVARFTSQD
jgi:heat shock protein HslJ